MSTFAGPGNYSWDGSTLTWTATADNQLPGLLNFSLGATNDVTVEANEDFVVSIANPGSTTGANIGLGAATAVTTTITDNDTATVSIAATTNAEEAGLVNGEFTITLTSPSSTDTVVNYTVAGTATSGNDYTALAGSATILAGSTTAITMAITKNTRIGRYSRSSSSINRPSE